MYSKITYYDTLYKRIVTDIVAGAIEFENTPSGPAAVFCSMGHREMIHVKHIKSIEPLED